MVNTKMFFRKSKILCYFNDFTLKMNNFMLFLNFMLAGTPVFGTVVKEV